ncbi:NAD(P)H-dependent FMN reductase [Neolewinella xylanilytica]|uniref:NAD(P)H-dependent FMN reductase n=1 Tax=Neolewinella xylanilytica TaxID=1514080 RepID=A0A2S6I4H5_9BACT|nr:NAD(P)H-dependent oxidoreductase [Neolewinella xylanilytica]PPK85981.1 NAD(P)H-dependent FMN reductase [Neolewinella xylanilytica]
MITVISGTNRPESRTRLFADFFAHELRDLGEAAEVLDMADLHHGYFREEMYKGKPGDPDLRELHRLYVQPTRKFAVFVPEYNGSYPGVLKLFLDGISVIDYAGNFAGKHVALIGLASGRAGNLRGIDHLADVFAHMGAWVLPNRLPISSIEELIEHDVLTDVETKNVLRKQAEQLIAA